ncbi:LysE/ArgO family amino acid transporter [Ignatzschineria cameli]|uniref:Amino acid transporter n=1 Tax=Ignatzschineria cameli TaxID=2182793 RepID=A0A2U2ASY0_9GAMM|nr:LysE family transporter [Ignatzschineria cameli]PWD87796.1 amino acid transporter [Ignatzschineria cameli]
MIWEIYLQGVLLSFGLIVAIGAQNAYVLKQGIQNNHIFWVATICFLCDFVLMGIGILGIGTIVAQNSILQLILALLGALYLAIFAYNSLRAMFQESRMETGYYEGQSSLRSVIIGTLAITLLNPHVYLDTIVIIGGIAGTLESEHKVAFLLGSLTASSAWFYSLGFAATKLAPIFRKPITWRILNLLIGMMMFFIVYRLLLFSFEQIMTLMA